MTRARQANRNGMCCKQAKHAFLFTGGGSKSLVTTASDEDFTLWVDFGTATKLAINKCDLTMLYADVLR